MLINGLKIEGKKNVVMCSANMVCHLCAMKYHDEHKNDNMSECYNAVRGKQLGNLMKVIPSLNDPNGEKVYICESCAKEIVDQLKAKK